jgi:aminodeoxyfutalosine deaminase
LIRYRAGWVVPISSPPIRDAWFAVDHGRVVAVGRGAPERAASDVDLGRVAVMPGLVNAHTHLELSHLRSRIPPASDFVMWIRGVIAASRQGRSEGNVAEVLAGVREAVDEAVRAGTAVVGDISNTLVTFGALVESPLAAVVFYELIRFDAANSESMVERASREIDALAATPSVRVTLAAHAPYSVAPRLFREIRQAVARDPAAVCSVHVSESAAEVEFIRTGGGPWRALLEEIGSWDPAWVAPGGSPVQFLEEHGFLDDRVLAVHGVQMTRDDLARLAARGVTLVTCPRSNIHTGAGVPPIAEFYASGVRVAVGTDSLASAPDLNVFAELAAMRRLAAGVPAARLLDSATRQGARALGFDADYGTIEPGKSARLIVVDIPPSVEDVEEYLVGGIQPDQTRWLDAISR